MDNEEKFTPQNGANGKEISFANIFYILRAHLILIIFITALFGAGGFAYSKVRKPVYTASVPVLFKTEMFNEKGGDGNSVNQVSSTNYLFAYLDTAVGVCKSGEVLDRANVYYHFYLSSKKDIDVFIGDLKTAYSEDVRAARAEIPDYEVTDALKKEWRDKFYTSSKVGTNYTSSKNSADTVVYFNLWVKDLNGNVAREMARIYAVAADVSLNQILDLGQGTAGLIELADKVSDVSFSSDMSPRNIIIIAAVLGFVVSLIMVYLLYLADNTVKGKEQLEQLTGANVIAYLEDVAEVK